MSTRHEAPLPPAPIEVQRARELLAGTKAESVETHVGELETHFAEPQPVATISHLAVGGAPRWRRQRRNEMFNNVIVGVDGQQGGREAIALARKLMAEGGQLALAHVYPSAMMPVGSSNRGNEAAERERSLEVLSAACEQAGVEADRICISSASVGQGLHEVAECQHADVLVIGSCRRGLIGRVFVNDDTRDALNGAPCAVAVVPAGYSQRAGVVREIGVGYNASPESQHALAVARELAVARGAKLSAFEAISLPAYFFSAPGAPVVETIDACVDEARERIAALGEVEPHAAYGTAAEELTVYSASLDMLFVGSRGYGPIGRLVHSSTSRQLARTARCPLIVLTRAATSVQVEHQTTVARTSRLAGAI
ncbi:MAG: universal stress protein [Solirubrobacteraceae bacterium]